MAVLMPEGKQSFEDSAGAPLVGGKLFTYDAGTSNPRPTYTTSAGISQNTNPIILDGRGEATIFWNGAYKIVLTDAAGATIWTVDNIISSDSAVDIAISLLKAQLADTASAVNGASMIGYNPALAYSLGLGAFLNDTYARTPAEIAAGITPTVYSFMEGDIRRYGATIAAANNQPAIDKAVQVCGKLPYGNWGHTTTITLGGNSTLSGCGYGSALIPNGCDGITVTNGGTIAGPAVSENFRISGTSTGSKSGIFSNMPAASGFRSTGREFNNIYIENFQYITNNIGLWNPTFYKVFGYNNYNGYLFSERSIKTTLIDCAAVKGAITGVGTQTAFQVLQVGAIRPENATLIGCYFYGYDRALDITNCLLFSASQCDFDNCQSIGINIGTVNGGVFIRDCWVNMNNASATIAVNIVASGSPIYEKVLLEGLNITNLSPFAGSIGVKAGNQQFGVEVRSCFIRDYADGVQFNANGNGICKHNNIAATARAILLDSLGSDYEIGPNYIISGTPLTFTGVRPPNLSLYASGSATLAVAGFTTGVNVTFAWLANGKEAMLYNSSSANGTSNAATMTTAALPIEVRPATGGGPMACNVRDNGIQQQGVYSIDTAGVITYGATAAQILTGGGFTAAGGKGITTGVYKYMLT